MHRNSVEGYGLFVRHEESALRAEQSACERHRNVGVLFLLDKLALVLLLKNGRTRSFPVLAVIRRTCGIAYRANCFFFDGC